MRLPHRESIILGPTPYEVFQEKEGRPSLTGFFIEDLMEVEVKTWARMRARSPKSSQDRFRTKLREMIPFAV